MLDRAGSTFITVGYSFHSFIPLVGDFPKLAPSVHVLDVPIPHLQLVLWTSVLPQDRQKFDNRNGDILTWE